MFMQCLVVALYNFAQYMSQDVSVCHISETTKQTGARKSIFVPSFLEKQRPMTGGRYTIWVVLACEVCAAIPQCFPKTKS